MKLIVDSGSSKANWAFVQQGQIISTVESLGLNPFAININDHLLEVEDHFSPEERSLTKEVFFYGSGCKGPKVNLVKRFLAKIFTNASTIFVASDLLGAARAIYSNNSGLIAILGTGSNVAYFNGESLNTTSPSLGFLLGDEGAGFHIGKLILQDYFYKRLDKSQLEIFTEMFKPTESLLSQLYDNSRPNKEIARFSRYLHSVSKEYRDRILSIAFESFIINRILPHYNEQNSNIGFCGSISFHFKDELIKACEKFGITVDNIIENPINELINYHCK